MRRPGTCSRKHGSSRQREASPLPARNSAKWQRCSRTWRPRTGVMPRRTRRPTAEPGPPRATLTAREARRPLSQCVMRRAGHTPQGGSLARVADRGLVWPGGVGRAVAVEPRNWPRWLSAGRASVVLSCVVGLCKSARAGSRAMVAVSPSPALCAEGCLRAAGRCLRRRAAGGQRERVRTLVRGGVQGN